MIFAQLIDVNRMSPCAIGGGDETPFDILFSLSAIVILALPLCLCALLVKWSSPGPAIYWSRRVGQNDNEFLILNYAQCR